MQSRTGLSALVVFAMLLWMGGEASAQAVFRCTIDGKTVYQSSPCPGQGTTVEVGKKPTAQQVEDAKILAEDDKTRAASIMPPPRMVGRHGQLVHPDEHQLRQDMPDCQGMRREQALAIKERDKIASRPLSMYPNSVDPTAPARQRDSDVTFAGMKIQGIEGRMTQQRCYFKPSSP